MWRATAAGLALLLAAPSPAVIAASAGGSIEGQVTVGDRPLRGATVAFVDVASGVVHRTASDANGHFSTPVPAGQYAITAESAAGLVVDHAPATVKVGAGRAVVADIRLLAVPGAMVQDAVPVAQDAMPAAQTPPPSSDAAPVPVPAPPSAPVTATTINHEPVTCMIAGQFPLITAGIEPAASVARARVYFRSAQSEVWYYVEMAPADTLGLEAALGFAGKLPRPKLEASPVTYYVQATTTEFGDAQTQEISAIVVNDAGDCEDRKLAAIGPPGEVTVFSAATGAAIAPAGFAVGGLALTLGTIALIVGGAAAAGITAAITVFNPEPVPTPAPIASPTPPPEPRPSPSPSPSPLPEPPPPPSTPFR